MSSAGPSRRPDGRKANELRPIHVSVGQLERADGSGRFSFGSEAALASFTGPIEVRLREELPDKATFEVTHRPLEGVGATPSRAVVTSLETIFPPLLSLSQHPRSLVQLVVQSLSSSPSSSIHQSSSVYPTIPSDQPSSKHNTWPRSANPSVDEDEDDYETSRLAASSSVSPMTGSYLASRATAINASTLAVLDAGSIPAKALPIAVSLADLGPERGIVLDPTGEEEKLAKSRFGFGWAYGAGISLAKNNATGSEGMDVDGQDAQKEAELVWVESEGDFTRREFSDALEASKIATRQILEHIRGELEKHLSKKRIS